jgi:hypothetical protein
MAGVAAGVGVSRRVARIELSARIELASQLS